MISPLQAQFQVWFAKALGAKRSKSRLCCTRVQSMSHDLC
jgi:hypothetical protein